MHFHSEHVLLDADAAICDPDGQRPIGECGVGWRTLRGGPSDGVQVVTLSNGDLAIDILPTRGMGVWKARYRQLPVGWPSPVRRPVHPSLVNLQDRNGLGWLNGFNELLCRCGLAFNGPPCDDNGTAVTLHGRIANLPAHRVIVRPATGPIAGVEVEGLVDETTMFGACFQLRSIVRIAASGARIDFIDEVTNLGGSPTPLSLLYHVNVGPPFLEGGGRNHVAYHELVPRDPRSAEGVAEHAVYAPPTTGFVEQAYYYRPVADESGWTTAVLHNAAATVGMAVHQRVETLPYFVVWKNSQALVDGFVTGLEPAVNLPNLSGFERAHERLPMLPSGGTYRTEFAWEFADSGSGVAALVDRVKTLQADVTAKTYNTPQPGWSPSGEATND